MTRTKERERLFQLVFQLILNPKCSFQKESEYIDSGINTISDKFKNISYVLITHLETWKVNEIGNVEKALLYLAIYEIFYSKLDYRIAVNEGVNLCKKFGDKDAYKFINGILAEVVLKSDVIKEELYNFVEKEVEEEINEHSASPIDEMSEKEKIESHKNEVSDRNEILGNTENNGKNWLARKLSNFISNQSLEEENNAEEIDLNKFREGIRNELKDKKNDIDLSHKDVYINNLNIEEVIEKSFEPVIKVIGITDGKRFVLRKGRPIPEKIISEDENV